MAQQAIDVWAIVRAIAVNRCMFVVTGVTGLAIASQSDQECLPLPEPSSESRLQCQLSLAVDDTLARKRGLKIFYEICRTRHEPPSSTDKLRFSGLSAE